MILSIKYNSEHASAPGARYSCDKMTFTEDTLGNYGRRLCLVLETLSYPYTSFTLTAPPKAEILHAPSARSNGGRSQEFWVIEEPFVRICNGMITKVCTVLGEDVPLIIRNYNG